MKGEKKRRGRERRRREEEKEGGSKPRSSQKGMETTLSMELWIFGMATNLDYGFYEIWHVSLGLYDDYLAQT